MEHPIYRVLSFEHVAPHTLRVEFDDATKQTINFLPVLKGELYGPLQELKLFDEVSIDPEVHTLVWSNGADFDPATLHDWDKLSDDLALRAKKWELEDANA
ncbi:MAG: DUF2442 domain-containing protein [Bacteroidota bacterium]|mgnify:CR=1 FL=1